LDNVKDLQSTDRETYLQCPYCTRHEGGHKVRVPKTVGKYRVKFIHGNILIFVCTRCSRIIKFVIEPRMYLWSRMKDKDKKTFKQNQKGGQEEHDKKI
jgi:ribosomal protein L24E